MVCKAISVPDMHQWNDALTGSNWKQLSYPWICSMIERAQSQGKQIDVMLLSRLLQLIYTSAPLFCLIDGNEEGIAARSTERTTGSV